MRKNGVSFYTLNLEIDETQPKKKEKKALPDFHKTQKENLIKRLETDVEINRSQRGKGTITISFKNDTDFERIISLLE